ncbi:hypothetical protein ACGYJ8_18125 [Sulfitobacter sp. 1A12126]|uniref:hypothetical protein n=1 Tax=Sulfitobacter sp. 1A12126 TaxID=3368591 RepID=UPI003744E5F7
MSAQLAQQARSLHAKSTDIAAASQADLVIEAGFEDITVSRHLRWKALRRFSTSAAVSA